MPTEDHARDEGIDESQGSYDPLGTVTDDLPVEHPARECGLHDFRGSYLPFERYTLVSALPPTVVVEWLAKNTGPRRWWTQNGPRLLQGTVDKDGFKVSPTIWYRNGWLPVIMGNVREEPGGGSRVKVRARPNVFAAIFSVLWMTFATVAGVAVLANGNLGGLIMPALGYLLIAGAFKLESRKVRKTLVRCLCSDAALASGELKR